MTECNAIIEANNEIDKLKRENKKLNAVCVEYGFEMGRLEEENEELKQALLFFLDVANSECSSSFQKDMKHDCKKLFNCSYNEAKNKYGGYDATWWELEE